ncbi:CFC_HP_G0057170.mRNA.1.CDS.1 [Saccharomyces cerevisiae]|nr:CFC_HP_G0057170.mRNA.1.CDS.1 [Saccharomyces cerevisiae]CAI6540185.1 CFC_HP_G0057170.mRNA.1.CDS.1 [Saccharomyces cerevisiae]
MQNVKQRRSLTMIYHSPQNWKSFSTNVSSSLPTFIYATLSASIINTVSMTTSIEAEFTTKYFIR